jgi:hypothetical protein
MVGWWIMAVLTAHSDAGAACECALALRECRAALERAAQTAARREPGSYCDDEPARCEILNRAGY